MRRDTIPLRTTSILLSCAVSIWALSCSDSIQTDWSFEETPPPNLPQDRAPSDEPDDANDDDEPGLLDPPTDEPDVEPQPEPDDELWSPYQPCSTGDVPLDVEPPTDQAWQATEFDPYRDAVLRTTEDAFGKPYVSNGSSGLRVFDGHIGHNDTGLIHHIFVNLGDPVVIRSIWQTGSDTTRWLEDRAAHSILVTVDHHPVPIEVDVWDATRDNQIAELAGPSVHYPLPSNRADVWDITIPAEHFTAGRTHDLTIYDSYTSDARASQEGFSIRVAVHYGGFETPETRPCSKRPLNAEPTEWERWANPGRYSAVLFPEGRQTPILAPDPTIVQAEPGSNQSVRLSFFRPRFEVFEVGETLGIYNVTLNGEPVAEPIWQRFGPRPVGVEQRVDARERFEFRLPTEPGIYDLVVLLAMEPWTTSWDMFGDPKPGITHNRNSITNLGSTIRYEVGLDGSTPPTE